MIMKRVSRLLMLALAATVLFGALAAAQENPAETVDVIRAKYKNVKQIVLQPVVGGPGNSRAARQHPVIVKAIGRVVADGKSRILAKGPSPLARSSNDFLDALGHLSDEAAPRIGKQIGEHYKQIDANPAPSM